MPYLLSSQSTPFVQSHCLSWGSASFLWAWLLLGTFLWEGSIHALHLFSLESHSHLPYVQGRNYLTCLRFSNQSGSTPATRVGQHYQPKEVLLAHKVKVLLYCWSTDSQTLPCNIALKFWAPICNIIITVRWSVILAIHVMWLSECLNLYIILVHNPVHVVCTGFLGKRQHVHLGIQYSQ